MIEFGMLRADSRAVPERTAGEIADLILDQGLAAGSRLPSLDELSQRLGVGRASLREALKLLDAWGVVSIRHGVGTFVADTADALRIPFQLSWQRSGSDIGNLYQLRLALEPAIAALATRRAGAQDVQEMSEAYDRMDAASAQPLAFIQADLAFHSALARATGNELLLMVMRPLLGLLHNAQRLAIQTPGAGDRAQSFHRAILEQVRGDRPEEARDAMRRHLAQAHREIEYQLERLGHGPLAPDFSRRDRSDPEGPGSKPALAEHIAGRLLDLIASQELEVGSQLPPLDELARQLGVSRTPLREGIKLLDAWGALDVRQGKGTFVTTPGARSLAIPVRITSQRSSGAAQKLHEVREVLEPDIAALAAHDAGPHQLEDLRAAFHNLAQSVGQPESYLNADLLFHTALATATGNGLFSLVISPVIDILHEVLRLGLRTPGASERAQPFHRQILDHVLAGESQQAREAMRRHLEQAWQELLPQLSREEDWRPGTFSYPSV